MLPRARRTWSGRASKPSESLPDIIASTVWVKDVRTYQLLQVTASAVEMSEEWCNGRRVRGHTADGEREAPVLRAGERRPVSPRDRTHLGSNQWVLATEK